MATEEDNQLDDVVSVEFPAPPGWTKKVPLLFCLISSRFCSLYFPNLCLFICLCVVFSDISICELVEHYWFGVVELTVSWRNCLGGRLNLRWVKFGGGLPGVFFFRTDMWTDDGFLSIVEESVEFELVLSGFYCDFLKLMLRFKNFYLQLVN